jgi:hypothetical protein
LEKIKIFVAVCAIKNYEKIFFEVVDKINELNKKAYEVNYILFGDPNLYHHATSRKDINVKAIGVHSTRLYESPGMIELYKDAQSDTASEYYAFFHLKGNAVNSNTGIDRKGDERRVPLENLLKAIDNLENIEKDVDYFDVIGWTLNNLKPYEQERWHAVPNFWISKCEHIKKLNLPDKENLSVDSKFIMHPKRKSKGVGHHSDDWWRYGCEMWIGFPQETVFYCLANKNHYKANTK